MDASSSTKASTSSSSSSSNTNSSGDDATSKPSGSDGAGGSSTGTGSGGPESNFDCNICLDTAKDAVVSICGHLFCWPCLHQWFETKPVRPTCPVCKNPISREQVIPLYGRGSSKKDPREKKIPPRPQGQRSEQDYASMGFPNFGFGDGFHMSFGIGAVPFGFFASTFNIGEFRTTPMMMDGMDLAQDRFLSNMFMWLALIFIVWLVFA